MLRYTLTQLPNKKYYGELMVQGGDTVMSCDEVHASLQQLRLKMGHAVSKLVQVHLTSFVQWRYNSIKKAGRPMWDATADALMKLNMLNSSMGYTNNMDAIIRRLVEHRVYVDALKPKTKCHLWNTVDEIVRWAEALMENRSQNLIILE